MLAVGNIESSAGCSQACLPPAQRYWLRAYSIRDSATCRMNKSTWKQQMYSYPSLERDFASYEQRRYGTMLVRYC
eukprot:scaffold158690_cov22-Prasinocladus_malaysianus.AAC.1